MSGHSSHPALSGAELRQRRAALGLSQAQLGRALGVDRQVIARWEREAQRPERPGMIRYLLRALARDQAWYGEDRAGFLRHCAGFLDAPPPGQPSYTDALSR